MQVVVFKLGSEMYGIETEKVQGIEKMMDITQIPCAPDYIKGLINLRGSIISVYDPYIKLGVKNEERDAENLLIIDADDEQVGVLVDRVIEVLDIDEDEVVDVSVTKEDERDYIKGTIKLKEYLVTLINVDMLLAAA